MNSTRIISRVALLLSASAALCSGATFRNPVLPGDYADPAVIRTGNEYWATATSSEWMPLFPLLRSEDLVNWQLVGNVFTERPEWAIGSFWAPEIWQHKGRYYMYYVARKRGGPLAVAVATADKPTGPWKDHGPLVAQEAGSIDAMPVADNDGTLYLIWKEDGNSRRKPTPLWIQKLNEDGTKLVGEMKEIMRNDADWEGQLIEGPFVMRRGEYWYLFYSGAGCCGTGCNYALGVARTRNLMGPWEKCPRNPLLMGTDAWKCPGHGSIVTDQNGRDWLLYHAYDPKAFVYVGRQGLLDEVTWREDGWPDINAGKGPSTAAPAPLPIKLGNGSVDFSDEFTSAELNPHWQWPVDMRPNVKTGAGKLELGVDPKIKDVVAGAVLGLRTVSGDYSAATRIDLASLKPGQAAGISAFGDRQHALGASVIDGNLVVWQRQRGKHQVLSTNAVSGQTLHLRLSATGGHKFAFSTSSDGQNWTPAGDKLSLDGKYLPPWDRGVRVALVAGGESTRATFGPIRVVNQTAKGN